jgi:hypothetical protein
MALFAYMPTATYAVPDGTGQSPEAPSEPGIASLLAHAYEIDPGPAP